MTVDRRSLLERASAGAQVVVGDLEAPVCSDEDQHHLGNVLRIRNAEIVIATDGKGSWRCCKWNDGFLNISSEIKTEVRHQPKITVGFSLLKGDRPEWIVQKLTELGVDVIRPFTSEHTVVNWDDKKCLRNHERFVRVAYQAAMQSRSVWLPTVESIGTFREVIDDGAALASPGGSSLSLLQPFVVVGPEGGWSSEELVTAAEKVDLGPTVLRAETAALTGGAILCALRAALPEDHLIHT